MHPGILAQSVGERPRDHAVPDNVVPLKILMILFESMLPPDTTHTILDPETLPANAAARAAAPAPSATTRFLSMSSRMAAATSSKSTTSDPARSWRTSGHISSSTLPEPIPSTKLGVYSISVGSPADQAAASAADVATSAA